MGSLRAGHDLAAEQQQCLQMFSFSHLTWGYTRVRLPPTTPHPASPQRVLCLETCSSTETRLTLTLWLKVFQSHTPGCASLWLSRAQGDYNLVFITHSDSPGPGKTTTWCLSQTFVSSQHSSALKASFTGPPSWAPGLKDTAASSPAGLLPIRDSSRYCFIGVLPLSLTNKQLFQK